MVACSATGSSSFYFGNEEFGGGNNSSDGVGGGNYGQQIRDYNFPGGAHGTLLSNAFSLEGYVAADQPVLYFNYFLDTEDTEYDPNPNPINPMRDAFRVYVVNEDGETTLVGTSDLFQDDGRNDEFEIGQNDQSSFGVSCNHPSSVFVGQGDRNTPCVQPLFESQGNQWRQARVELDRFAGQKNLKLRFDFSTAASFDLGNINTTGQELRAIPGADVRDAQIVTIRNGSSFQTSTLEFDAGITLVAPTGANITQGDTFTLDNGVDPAVTFEFNADGFFARSLAVPAADQFGDGDVFQVNDGVAAIPFTFELDRGFTLSVPAAGAAAGGVSDGNSFLMTDGGANSVRFELDTNGVVASGTAVNIAPNRVLAIAAVGSGIAQVNDGGSFILDDGLGLVRTFQYDRDGIFAGGNTRIDIADQKFLQVPAVGAGVGGVLDGHQFNVNAGLGGPDEIFEFDKNGVFIDVDTNLVPDNHLINITDHFLINVPFPGLGAGGVLDGQYFAVTVGPSTTEFEFDTDGTVSLGRVPVALDMSLVAIQRGDVADAMVAAINGAAISVSAQRSGAAGVRLANPSPSVSIDLAGAPKLTSSRVVLTQAELADLIATAISSVATLNVNAVNEGAGRVVLENATAGHSITLASLPLTSGVRAISQAVVTQRTLDAILASGFAFTSTSAVAGQILLTNTIPATALNTAGSGGVSNFSIALNQNEVADRIVSAVNGTPLGLTSSNLGAGVVHLGGDAHTIDTANAPGLTVAGSAGITTLGATRIAYVPSATADQMAIAIANVIAATTATTATPVSGIITLGAGATFSSGTSPITPDGVVPILFAADLSATEVAKNMEAAIAGVGLVGGGTVTTQFISEPNSSPATPFVSGLSGSGVFRGTGILSPTSNLDLISVTLNAGDRISIDVDTFGSTLDTFGGLVDPAFTVFLAYSDDDPAPGETASLDYYVDTTVLTSGNYYVYVALGGGSGAYDIEISVNGSTAAFSGGVFRSEHRVNVPGIALARSADLPTSFIEGGLGVGANSTPVHINSSMSDSQVAVAIARAASSALAGYETTILAVDGSQISDGQTFTVKNVPDIQPSNLLLNETNDTLFRAVNSGLTGGAGFYLATGQIGDNPQVTTNPALDVDLVRLNLLAGDTIYIDIDAAEIGSPLDSTLVLFNAAGAVVATNADGASHGELATTDSYLVATVTTAGTYYVGVSADANNAYNPLLQGSGAAATTTGNYQLEISINERHSATFEFDAGTTLTTPDPLTLQVPSGSGVGGGIVADGDRFTVSNGVASVVFEFDNNGFVGGLRTPIPFTFLDTQNDIAKSIANALANAGLGLNPSNLGNGQVLLGALANHTLTLPFNSRLTRTGQAASLADGEAFLINDGVGGGNIVFEFDSNGITDPTAIPVAIGVTGIRVPIAGGATLTGGIADGEKFSVTNALGVPVIFEFDSNGFLTSPTNRRITFASDAPGPASTQNQVVDAIVLAINNAGLGFTAVNSGTGAARLNSTASNASLIAPSVLSLVALPATRTQIVANIVTAIGASGTGVVPTDLGNGNIQLSGTTQFFDTSGAAALITTGTIGASTAGAIVIPYTPTLIFTANNAAQAISTAIRSASIDITTTVAGRRVKLAGQDVAVNLAGTPLLSSELPNGAITTEKELVRLIGGGLLSQNLGPFGINRLGFEDRLAGDEFGAYSRSRATSTGYAGALRAMDNAHEGVYVDDVIIGFAERGEMVLNSGNNTIIDENFELLNDELNSLHNETLVGDYQLEIRAGDDFGQFASGTFAGPSGVSVTKGLNTNSRSATQYTLVAKAGAVIADGDTFEISDGVHRRVFEFDDLSGTTALGVRAGNVQIGYLPADNVNRMAEQIRDAINAEYLAGGFTISAALSDGTDVGLTSTGSMVDLVGDALFFGPLGVNAQINSGYAVANDEVFRIENTSQSGEKIESVTLTLPSGLTFDTVLRSGTAGFNVHGSSNQVGANFTTLNPDEVTIDFSRFEAGQKFVFGLDIFGPFINRYGAALGRNLVGTIATIRFSSGREVIDTFSRLPVDGGVAAVLGGNRRLAAIAFSGQSDQNTPRDQGQIIVHSNQIADSLNYGIRADAGARTRDDLATLAATTAHPGPPINFNSPNNQNLAPGPVIANNVISGGGQGGILFSGDTNAAQQGAVSFGRIVNNTIYGDLAAFVGIQVEQSASPTLLNNIVSGSFIGVSVDNSSLSTVIGATLFKDNDFNGLIGGTIVDSATGVGSAPIVLTSADPLFVDPVGGNFYPQANSQAIDSSLDSLQDRDDFANRIKAPLGIGPSPILAPDRDAFGQLRVDDPRVSTPAAQGSNVFKDRGGLDRADVSGPTSILVNPRDNDAEGADRDRNPTYVRLESGTLSNFEILIEDGEGTGPDRNTITSQAFVLTENGRTLVDGVDYVLGFNATSNTIRFTPVSGIWRPGSVYEISVNNRDRIVVNVPIADIVSDGDQFVVTDATGASQRFEFESGFTLAVPQSLTIQVPPAGAAAISDGESFRVSNGVTTVAFEFDFDGNSLNVPIGLVPADTASDVATKIVNALIAQPLLGLAPKTLPGGVVHLGSRPNHTLDVSGSSLSQSGQPAGVQDGEILQIGDGTNLLVIEFDSNGVFAPTSTVIDVAPSRAHTEIAADIAQAIRAAGLGLDGTLDLGRGAVNLGGSANHTVDATLSTITVQGQPGVAPAITLFVPGGGLSISDAATFTISNGTTTVTFEFDKGGSVTPGNVAIAVLDGWTQDQVANAIVTVLQNAGVGVNPVNLGSGAVALGESARHSINLGNSGLTSVGVPGGAIAVLFRPASSVFSLAQMQGALLNAIRQSSLTNVAATARDRQTIFLDGATAVLGLSNSFITGIKDVAGNTLQPNRPPDDTRFTILTPGVLLDYGDAPDGTAGATASYASLLVNNGARHALVSRNGLRLGTRVDAEPDGQPTLTANGDDIDIDGNDDDGVIFGGIFTPGFGPILRVTASDFGFVDGWVDFNQDGDWDDFGEKILDSVPVVTGENILNPKAVPAGAALGDTFARFRISRVGSTFPTGLVVDGEVEDYLVRVLANSPPFVAKLVPTQTGNEDGPNLTVNLDNVGGMPVFDDEDLVDGDMLIYTARILPPLMPPVPPKPALVNLSVVGSIITLTPRPDQNGSAVVEVTATDRAGRMATTSFTVTILAVNDAPVLTLPVGTQSAIEDVAKVISGITGADVDLTPTDIVRLTLTTLNAGSILTVNTNATGGVRLPNLGANQNGTNAITINATIAQINATFASSSGLVYRGAQDFNGNDVIRVTLNDLGQHADLPNSQAPIIVTGDISIAVAAVNDTPTLTTLGNQEVAEDTDLVLNGLVISDPDVGNALMEVTITATEGIVRLNAANGIDPAGLIGANSGANNSAFVKLRGTLSQLNAVVNGMVFRGRQDFNGPASLSITVNDLGNLPGPPRQSTQSIAIQVLAVNDAPSFAIAQPLLPAINEDSGAQTVALIALANVSRGPADEAGQAVSFQMTRVIGAGDLAFSVSPTINPSTGSLSYTSAANANGQAVFDVLVMDNGGVETRNASGVLLASGVDKSAPIRITITVNAVNDAPRFIKGANQQINEDALDPVDNTRLQTVRGWATSISRGPLSATDEVSQALTFKVVPVPSGLLIGNLAFTAPPAIDPVTGNLTYETVPDTNGTRVFRVTLEDDGNGVFPNVNTSTVETLTISVAAVNDPPSFNIAGTSQTINEDAPLQTVQGFVSNISRGPAMPSDEDGQVLTFNVAATTTIAGITTDASAVFSQFPSVSTVNGNLTYQILPDVNGVFVVSLELDDSGTGPTSPPNNDKSPKQTFTITVNPINDAPKFTLVDQNTSTPGVIDLSVNEDAGPVMISGFATGVSRGPIDESTQVLAFDLTVQSTTRSLAFSTLPAISLNGVNGQLTFQTAPNTNGSAIIVVSLRDDGNGTAPHANTSAPQTFTVNVNSVNDSPFVANAVADFAVNEDAPVTEIELFPNVFQDFDINAFDNDSLTLTVVNATDLSTQGLISTSIVQTPQSAILKLTYLPNRNGVAEVIVQAQDRNLPIGATVLHSFTVTVRAVNDAAVIASSQALSAAEDTLTTLTGLSITDSDAAETANGNIEVKFEVTHGTLTVNPLIGLGITDNGTKRVTVTGTPASFATLLANPTGLRYLSDLDYNGIDSLVIEVNDGGNTGSGGALTSVATVPLTVTAVNDAPTAVNDAVATPEDIVIVINGATLRANDLRGPSNESDQSLLVTGVGATSSQGGTVVLNTADSSNHTITYTPPKDFVGTDTFTYQITDNDPTNVSFDAKSAVGTVTVTISAVNDPPVPGPDAQSVDEDIQLVFDAVTLIGNDIPGPTTATDEVGQLLSVIAVSSTSSAGGVVSLTSGAISYTPPLDFFGTDTFTYNVRDNGTPTASAIGTVTVTVRPVNDVPVPVSDLRTTVEDTRHVFNAATLAQNDAAGPSNESSQSLSVIGVSPVSANQGTVSLVSGVITYTPFADFNGEDYFTYTVADNGSPSRTATGTVTMNVTAVNDAPSAGTDLRTTAEDTALTIAATTLLNNDLRGPANESGQTLTVQSVSLTSAQGGTVTLDVTNQIVYTPKADFSGNDTFTYTVVDNGLTNGVADPKNATATVTVTVTPVNDAPIAVTDIRTTNEDQILTIDTSSLLANDFPGPTQDGADKESNQSLTVTATSQTSTLGGTVTLVGNTVTYSPPANFDGVDTFTYQIQDNGTTNGLPDPRSGMGTVTVNIVAINDPPIMTAASSVTIEDQQLLIPPSVLTQNDRGGPDTESSQTLTVIAVVGSSAQGGIVALDASGTVTYTPPLNFNGIDTFTYTARDNGLTNGASDPQTALGTHTVTVTPANDPPIAVNDAFAANEDAVLQVQGRGVLGNDFDIDLPANTLTVSTPTPLQSDQGAIVTLNTDGTFIYNPTAAAKLQALRPGQQLIDRFRYRAFDGSAESNEATVNVTVAGVNDAPVAVNDTFTVLEDTQLTVNVAASILLNDTDAEETDVMASLTVTRISGPANGTLNLNSNGTFIYTPTPNFNGVDTFVYRTSDGATNSNAATVTIQVTTINDPPNAGPDAYSTTHATQLIVNAANGVLRNDTDSDQTTPLTAQLVAQPTNGTVVLSSNGSFVYTPNGNFSGTDRFTYRAIDDGGLPSAATPVTITVAAAASFQNPTLSRDVNADGFVSPIDVLLLINHLNTVGSHLLTAELPGIPFPDTNGDNNVSPSDVLLVVNQLNSSLNQEGEEVVQVAAVAHAAQPLVAGLAIPPTTGDMLTAVFSPATVEQLDTEDDDTPAADFFAEMGQADFARQYQALSSSARASLATKAKDLESVLDSLCGQNGLEEEQMD